MPLEPRELDIPKIPGALRFYVVMSFITGTFLLLLVAEMILRYGFGLDLEIAGPFGFIHLTPHEQVTAVNGSTAVLIIHGWLYVFYLIACFRLWAFMRWSFLTLIVLALGGASWSRLVSADCWNSFAIFVSSAGDPIIVREL